MKKRIEKLRHELLDIADYVQDAAYDNHRSLSMDQITEMLELSAQLSSVAGRVDSEDADSDNPDVEQRGGDSQQIRERKRSRFMH